MDEALRMGQRMRTFVLNTSAQQTPVEKLIDHVGRCETTQRTSGLGGGSGAYP